MHPRILKREERNNGLSQLLNKNCKQIKFWLSELSNTLQLVSSKKIAIYEYEVKLASAVRTVAADWVGGVRVRRRLLRGQQPVLCGMNRILLPERVVSWLGLLETTTRVRLTSPTASGHGCGLRLLIIWNDLLSLEDRHVTSNVSRTMAHEGPFLQSNISQALVSSRPPEEALNETECIVFFLGSPFLRISFEFAWGTSLCFSKQQRALSSMQQCLAGLSSSWTAQHSLHVVKFTQLISNQDSYKKTPGYRNSKLPFIPLSDAYVSFFT